MGHQNPMTFNLTLKLLDEDRALYSMTAPNGQDVNLTVPRELYDQTPSVIAMAKLDRHEFGPDSHK